MISEPELGSRIGGARTTERDPLTESRFSWCLQNRTPAVRSSSVRAVLSPVTLSVAAPPTPIAGIPLSWCRLGWLQHDVGFGDVACGIYSPVAKTGSHILVLRIEGIVELEGHTGVQGDRIGKLGRRMHMTHGNTTTTEHSRPSGSSRMNRQIGKPRRRMHLVYGGRRSSSLRLQQKGRMVLEPHDTQWKQIGLEWGRGHRNSKGRFRACVGQLCSGWAIQSFPHVNPENMLGDYRNRGAGGGDTAAWCESTLGQLGLGSSWTLRFACNQSGGGGRQCELRLHDVAEHGGPYTGHR